MTRPQAVALAATLILLSAVIFFGLFRRQPVKVSEPETPTVIDTIYVKRAAPRDSVSKKKSESQPKPVQKPVSRDYLNRKDSIVSSLVIRNSPSSTIARKASIAG